MSNHYAGVFIYDLSKVVREMKVLCVQDEHYLRRPFDGTRASLEDNGDVKMPGGMMEVVSGDGRDETPEETMKRESVSETGVQVLSGRLVYREEKKDFRTGDIHHRYFFLATEVSGLPSQDAPPRRVTETNPSDGSVERLVCYWRPLRDFARRLFRGQYLAFGAILAELANDQETGREFCMVYGDLLDQFSTSQS